MKNSTAYRIKQIPEKAIIVGIDPHKKKHTAAIMTPDAYIHKKFKFDNSMDGFERLLTIVEEQMSKMKYRNVIFAIEAGSHYWRNIAYFLDGRGILFRLISPFTLKRRRDGNDNDRKKNDYRDAGMAAELLRSGQYLDGLLLHGDYAEIRSAYTAYRRWMKGKTTHINQLKALLEGVFPEFTKVFKDPCGKTASALLLACAIPGVIARMRPEDLMDLARHEFEGRYLMVKKLRELQVVASTSMGIKEGAQSMSLEIKAQVRIIRQLNVEIDRARERVINLLHSIDDSRYLLSITGIGPMTAAGILAELGPFSSYASARQMIKMAGTNPTQAESAGKSGKTPISKKGRAGLRWCLWPGVITMLRSNPDFRAWAKFRCERRGNEHPLKKREVIIAAQNRLLRLCFALVMRREYYHMPTCNTVIREAILT